MMGTVPSNQAGLAAPVSSSATMLASAANGPGSALAAQANAPGGAAAGMASVQQPPGPVLEPLRFNPKLVPTDGSEPLSLLHTSLYTDPAFGPQIRPPPEPAEPVLETLRRQFQQDGNGPTEEDDDSQVETDSADEGLQLLKQAAVANRPKDDVCCPFFYRLLRRFQTRRWRKYGSKKLKGIADERRDYYRCTMAGCSAKKIVEIHVEKDGRQTDSCAYKGTHNHAEPVVTRYEAGSHAEFFDIVNNRIYPALAALPPVEEAEDEPAEILPPPAPTGEAVATAGTTGVGAPAEPPKKIVRKKKKLPEQFVDVAPEVEPSQDGWQWRKYGRKEVKNCEGAPRDYFKCSTGNTCPARKKIQTKDTAGTPTQGYAVAYEGAHSHARPQMVGRPQHAKPAAATVPSPAPGVLMAARATSLSPSVLTAILMSPQASGTPANNQAQTPVYPLPPLSPPRPPSPAAPAAAATPTRAAAAVSAPTSTPVATHSTGKQLPAASAAAHPSPNRAAEEESSARKRHKS